jgi:hypothetical protein
MVLLISSKHLCDKYHVSRNLKRNQFAVPDVDKERPYAIPPVKPLPIPNLHDWRKIEVCLINFNKGKDDEGCLEF